MTQDRRSNTPSGRDDIINILPRGHHFDLETSARTPGVAIERFTPRIDVKMIGSHFAWDDFGSASRYFVFMSAQSERRCRKVTVTADRPHRGLPYCLAACGAGFATSAIKSRSAVDLKHQPDSKDPAEITGSTLSAAR